MKVLLVDDEPIMLLTMKRMLSGIEGVELVGSFQQAEEAFTFLCNHDVDLAFFDIQIGSDDGIELARKLRFNHIELDIVFTTSHVDYAIHAYDVYPLDYMVKPISKKDWLKQLSGRLANVKVLRLSVIARWRIV